MGKKEQRSYFSRQLSRCPQELPTRLRAGFGGGAGRVRGGRRAVPGRAGLGWAEAAGGAAAVGARSPSASEQGRPWSGLCRRGCGIAVAALRLRNSSHGPSLPFPSGPAAAMGSRASTLLRDEEIEEIKKETGCECGGLSAAGRGGQYAGSAAGAGPLAVPGAGQALPGAAAAFASGQCPVPASAAPGAGHEWQARGNLGSASRFPPTAAGSSSEIPAG